VSTNPPEGSFLEVMTAMSERGRGDGRFEALFDEHFARCVHVARRIVHDHQVAEELAAETFARAWARWPRLGHDERAAGWLLRVTANLAIDVTRKRRAPPAVVGVAPSSDDSTALHLALVAALQSLPRRQRGPSPCGTWPTSARTR